MRTPILVVALAASLAVAAGSVAAAQTFTPRKCGNDHAYAVTVFQAPLACTTAQSTMTRFILSGTIARGWFCRYGHSRDAWAATCARTAKNAPIVRAYLVAG